MSYQGTFLSETPTINRTFGDGKTTTNSHKAKWTTKLLGDKVTIETTDGRSFVVDAKDAQTYNKVVNKVQLNTL
tara:strand:+ start:186 stop:407 length:222 start_codon:yes stop_codon:yes gene_type:complete